MYTSLIAKYTTLTATRVREIVDKLVKYFYMSDNKALIQLAISDLLVNGDLDTTPHSQLKTKYSITDADIVNCLDNLAPYFYMIKVSAVEQLAILDLMINGDI